MFKIFIKAYRGTREAWEWKNALEKKCHTREGGNPGALLYIKRWIPGLPTGMTLD